MEALSGGTLCQQQEEQIAAQNWARRNYGIIDYGNLESVQFLLCHIELICGTENGSETLRELSGPFLLGELDLPTLFLKVLQMLVHRLTCAYLT